MVKMFADFSEALIDGYCPDEPTGEIFFQSVEWLFLKSRAKESIAIRKEVERGLREARDFVIII